MRTEDTKFYKALRKHYEAQRDEAVATLDLYFTNAVGIGEHSNILNELKEWTQKLCDAKLCDADEALCVLERYFEED
jgi:hypothetical protein